MWLQDEGKPTGFIAAMRDVLDDGIGEYSRTKPMLSGPTW